MLNFVRAALSPAAALAPSAHAHQTTSADKQDCDCCDKDTLGAARARAAFCHAGLPSLVTALPQSSRGDLALLVLKACGDGLALQPPAPPPRR